MPRPSKPQGSVSDLRRLLQELAREFERLSERNELLERQLSRVSGALAGSVRVPDKSRTRSARVGSRPARRGAPPKFDDAQARQLRLEYERGATSAQLARKYRASLPTILSTLRRAGTPLRRGRPSRRKGSGHRT